MSVSLTDLATIVAGLAAAVQAIVVVVAAVYALGQVREARKGRSAEIVLYLFDRLHNREASERRRTLYQDISPIYPNITDEQDRVIQDVISDFYLVGYLVELELLDFNLVAGLYYGSAIRCWRASEEYIKRERERRGTQYAHYFETLYRRCCEYLASARPTDNPLIFLKSPDSEPIDDSAVSSPTITDGQ